MDKLPTEILEKIFAISPKNTLSECTLVCHKWLKVTRPFLYSHISLREDRFDKLIKAVNMEPLLGYLTRQLELKNTTSQYNYFNICNLFPNLKRFYLKEPRCSKLPLLDCDVDLTETCPTSKLEEVYEKDTFSLFTGNLIKMNLCSQLKKLALIRVQSELIPVHTSDDNPIYFLKNMPVLEDLTLDLGLLSFDLDSIEILHHNIPTIQSLTIKNACLISFGKSSKNMTSNTTIRIIDWDFHYIDDTGSILESYIQCFQYIQKKYSNIENIAVFCFGYNLFTSIEKDRIYNDGWLPILQSKGPQLKHIGHLDVDQGMDIFKVLDDFNCKVESLNVFSSYGEIDIDKFTYSNQRHYIRHLSVENVLHYHKTPFTDTKLEILDIKYSEANQENVLILNNILKTCPATLHSLSLRNISVVVDNGGNNEFQTSITSFKIDITPNLYWYFNFDTDDVNQIINKVCPRIQSIDVSIGL